MAEEKSYREFKKTAAELAIKKKILEEKAQKSGKSFCFCPTREKEESYTRCPIPELEMCPICGRSNQADARFSTTSQCDFIFVSPAV